MRLLGLAHAAQTFLLHELLRHLARRYSKKSHPRDCEEDGRRHVRAAHDGGATGASGEKSSLELVGAADEAAPTRRSHSWRLRKENFHGNDRWHAPNPDEHA